MNKKLLCLLISSFLLSGCANFKKINANELAAERDAQKATEYAKKIRNNPVIQDSTKQWINTTPIIEKQVKQSAPPCRSITNTTASKFFRLVIIRHELPRFGERDLTLDVALSRLDEVFGRSQSVDFLQADSRLPGVRLLAHPRLLSPQIFTPLVFAHIVLP